MTSRLQSLIDRVDRAHREAESVIALARAVRDALREQITEPGFMLDCLERMLYAPALSNTNRRWMNPAVHVNPQLNYAFRIFFWAPGYVNAPHRHNTWGVTGVLHNQCSVFLYRASDQALSGEEGFVVDKRLVAEPGEVGYVPPGCTHSVGNPGESVSATFHVFSASPEEQDRPNDTIWYRRPGAKGRFKDQRYKVMLAAAGILAKIRDERSVRLLEHVFPLGGPAVKFACVKALAEIDQVKAASLSEEFYASLPASSHEALHTILAARPIPGAL